MKQWPAYLKWRDGRPRWEPGPGLRAAGFSGRDLKDASGQWLSKGAAVERADALNGEIAAWRGTGVSVAPKARHKHPRSLRALYTSWNRTPEFALLSAKTRRNYMCNAEIFLTTPLDDSDPESETFEQQATAAISRKHLKNLWRHYYRTRGHTMANKIIAVIRSMLAHALDEEWIASNPALRLKLRQPQPRLSLWLPDEVALLVATADTLLDKNGHTHADVADAFIAALHTGQRLGDVLALPDRLFDETRVRLSQFKTHARIDAPMTPALLARVAEIRARRRSGNDVVIDFDRPLIQRPDGKEHDPSSFNKRFRAVRIAAGAKLKEDGSALACPEIGRRTLQDTRDTAVTRLALAECTMAEIAAITGHNLASITQVMRHYLALQPAMADAAIGKLNAWMAREEIAL